MNTRARGTDLDNAQVDTYLRLSEREKDLEIHNAILRLQHLIYRTIYEPDMKEPVLAAVSMKQPLK